MGRLRGSNFWNSVTKVLMKISTFDSWFFVVQLLLFLNFRISLSSNSKMLCVARLGDVDAIMSSSEISNEQGKSEGFDSCDQPSNLTQIGFKSSIFQPV